MDECDLIELEVPLSGEYARLVRLTAAFVAEHCGLDIDRIDDVKMAAEEAFLLAAAIAKSPGVARMSMAVNEEGVRFVLSDFELGHDEQEAGAGARCWQYGLFVLSAIADEARLVPHGDRADLIIRIGADERASAGAGAPE